MWKFYFLFRDLLETLLLRQSLISGLRWFISFSLRACCVLLCFSYWICNCTDHFIFVLIDWVEEGILLFCWSSCSWFHWRKWDTWWYLWNNLKQRSCYATHFRFCTGLSLKSNKLEHSFKTVFLGVLIYSVFSCCGVHYDDMIQADNLEKIFSHMKPNSILGFPCKRE